MQAGQALDCNDCEDRKQQLGYYCDFCPNVRAGELREPLAYREEPVVERPPEPSRRPKDDSIVLL
jgi:hypothetical protein